MTKVRLLPNFYYWNLNYENYYEKGDKPLSREIDYTSENTNRLDLDMMVNRLLDLEYIKNELER